MARVIGGIYFFPTTKDVRDFSRGRARPLAEANPVHRNDSAVDEAEPLTDGDKIRFGGGSTFRFRTIEGP